jgi:hypothetical protein
MTDRDIVEGVGGVIVGLIVGGLSVVWYFARSGRRMR